MASFVEGIMNKVDSSIDTFINEAKASTVKGFLCFRLSFGTHLLALIQLISLYEMVFNFV